MKSRLILVVVVIASIAMLTTIVFAQGKKGHLNPMVDLLAQKKAVFGISPPNVPPPANANPGGAGRGQGAPAAAANSAPRVPDICGIMPPPPPENRGGGGGAGRGRGGDGAARGGANTNAPAPLPVPKDLAEATRMALANHAADYLFNGSMEGGVDRVLPAFTEFMNAMKTSGNITKAPYSHLTHPLILKTAPIAESADGYIQDISKQLNTGASGLMFVDVDCAKEVQVGLAAMRFKSKGGTRPEAVGMAPAYWGMNEKDYKKKADLWPLNKDGELVNWVIIETKEGVKNRRAIAAVKGVGVLWPGAGTLGGVYTVTQPDGTRVRDNAAWEEAIQQILAACKEFNIACGFPVSTPADVELRLKQGFSVFVSQSWSQGSFDTIAAGRKAAGRPATNDTNR